MTTQEAADTALLLRAGSLAAPMEIVEERTIGPSLGAENIAKGFKSVTWGFLGVVLFMILYYHLFGVFSALALGLNLLLLVELFGAKTGINPCPSFPVPGCRYVRRQGTYDGGAPAEIQHGKLLSFSFRLTSG